MSEAKTTRKERQEVASLIGPIVDLVDVIERVADTKKMRRMMEEMCGRASTLDALPFPETMQKGQGIRDQAHLLDGIIRLIEARRKQKENAGKKQFVTGLAVLKMMGF